MKLDIRAKLFAVSHRPHRGVDDRLRALPAARDRDQPHRSHAQRSAGAAVARRARGGLRVTDMKPRDVGRPRRHPRGRSPRDASPSSPPTAACSSDSDVPLAELSRRSRTTSGRPGDRARARRAAGLFDALERDRHGSPRHVRRRCRSSLPRRDPRRGPASPCRSPTSTRPCKAPPPPPARGDGRRARRRRHHVEAALRALLSGALRRMTDVARGLHVER